VTTRRRLDGGERRAEVPALPAPERGRVRWSRVFWIGAAAILVAAALIAVAAILRGDFSETEAKILGTLLSLLVAGATAITGLSLVERRESPTLGWVAVAGAALCFVLQAAAIWDEFSADTLTKLGTSSMAALLALFLITTQRALLREQRLARLFYATAASAGIAAGLTVVGIWLEEGGFWQAVAVFCILAVLGYLLLPVVQRLTTTSAPQAAERVLAELNGVRLVATRSGDGIEARLAPGERLALRR
jgi:hypothetical protein